MDNKNTTPFDLEKEKEYRQRIEELSQKNRELSAALEEAEAASQAKNSFLSNMSHDIRTPMNAIVGLTNIALSHIDEKSRVQDSLTKIRTTSAHLMSLINDVLDMSRIESGKASIRQDPFALADLIHDIVVIIRMQANEKKQTLHINIHDIAEESLLGDELHLRQIFVNILNNAVKYTQSEGSIWMELCEFSSKEPNKVVLRFVCTDNGMGMSEEFLTKIFQPFERAESMMRSKIEGTGLGMSIVQRLIVQMGGTITVESRLGEGSTFVVELPLSVDTKVQRQVKELQAETLLIVEEQEEQAQLISRYLTEAGAVPVVLGTGQEAITWLTMAGYEAKPPCAILLGQIPDVPVLELTAYMRELVGKELPIILVSEGDWAQMEYRALHTGISAFVPCPLFKSRLLSTMKSVIGTNAGKAGEGADGDYSGKRFLLVEDNELNQEIAKELLSTTGAEIETADNGAEAVEIFEKSAAGYYDLIFMDVQMPVMDGYEATKKIRAMERQDAGSIPIVAMTANAFVEDIRQSREAGMSEHLSKPVDVKHIMEILHKLLT